jgi:hypothetical protein
MFRDDNPDPSIHTRGRARRRPPRRARLWPVVVALAIGVAACGGGSDGPTVAGSGSAKQTGDHAAGTGSKKGSALAFSKCMRAHGIADFPDPNGKGQIQIGISQSPGSPSSDLEPNNPKFQAAQQACKAFAPTAGTPAQQADRKAHALKYSKCMRSHGIADFPDPNSSGGLEIKAGPGSDLDPNSSLFQAADKACQKLMPAGKGGGSLSSHTEGAP